METWSRFLSFLIKNLKYTSKIMMLVIMLLLVYHVGNINLADIHIQIIYSFLMLFSAFLCFVVRYLNVV